MQRLATGTVVLRDPVGKPVPFSLDDVFQFNVSR